MLTGERAVWSVRPAGRPRRVEESRTPPRMSRRGARPDRARQLHQQRRNHRRQPNDETHVPPEGTPHVPVAIDDGAALAEVELLARRRRATSRADGALSKEHLKNMGAMTALAIALHNFPEGARQVFVAALADAKPPLPLSSTRTLSSCTTSDERGVRRHRSVYYATGSKLKAFCGPS